MSKFINPFTDVGFKRIFGQEVNKSLLIEFLNSLLEGEQHIDDISLLDKEQLPQLSNDRGLIYDVFCKTSDGKRIIVEMQNRSQENFKERALLYLPKAIVEQSVRGKEGKKYEISAVYGVFFMNFHESAFDKKFRTDVVLSDRDTNKIFSDKLRMTFLQLPEFNKVPEECESYFDKWIYVLKHMDILDRLPWKAQYEAFKKLASICDFAKLSEDERKQYEESERILNDNIAIANRALAEGMNKGRAEGMAQGMAKGMAKGRTAEKKDIALKMKQSGLETNLIASITGLSIEEIEAL
ncbi:MAG: PD-(D/E)XK nuclease family transposase [Bacteroidales bacterium]|nr:PD-(D/E)XK nuclease family transposase [Bacteroidales bacterium]